MTDGSSNLQLWLEADTLSLSDGATVSTWNDGSGKGNTATSSGSPAFQSSGLNGRASVEFVPTDSDTFTTANTINSVSTESVFFATEVASAAGDKAFLGSTTNNNYTLRDRGNASTGWNIGGFTDGTTSVRGATPLGTKPAILSGVRTIAGDSIALWGNGSLLKSTTHSSGTLNLSYRIGARNPSSEFFNGQMGEVIAFDRDVAAAERIAVENYLSAKFDVGISSDFYAGDTGGNGDFDLAVFGIGQSAEDSIAFESTGAAGFGLDATGNLADGDFAFAGHRSTGNSIVVDNARVRRWERTWYVDQTGSFEVDLAFDFSDAGLEFDPALTTLLFAPDAGSEFEALEFSPSSISGDQIVFTIPAGQLSDGIFALGTIVPEPSSASLALTGFGAIILRRRRRRAGIAKVNG